MPRFLPLLLLASLLVGCAALPSPVPGGPAAAVPPTLGVEPVVEEIGPGERHRYRLDVAPGRWVTIELVQREVALELALFDAADAVVITSRSPVNWSTEAIDLLTGDDGPFEVEVAAPEEASRRGSYLLRLAEERPARRDDQARHAARRRLRDLERPPPDASRLSADEEEALLRGLLESHEITWSGEEAARIHGLLGAVALALNRPVDAAAEYRVGLDRLAGADSPPLAALLRLGLGGALASQGLIAEAREEYRAGVEAARASGDGDVCGHAVNRQARFLYEHGEVEAAILGLHEVVAGLDPPHRFYAHLNLALFQRDQGRLETALAHHAAAERLTREAAVDSAVARFSVLRLGGVLYRTAGEVDDAVTAFREALRVALDEELTAWETSIRIHLGTLLVHLGWYPEARRHLERSAMLAEQAADADHHARALSSLAWVELGEGDAAVAAALLGRALSTDLPNQRVEPLRYALAMAKIALGESAEARELLEPLAARAEAKGLQLDEADCHYALGSLHLTEGALDEAAVALGRAAELATKVGIPLRQAAVSSRLAELEVERGRPAAALEHVLEALRLQEAARSRLVEPELRSSFLARWRGDYDRAIEISMHLAAVEPGAGHDRGAFALSEAAHARTLTELLTEARVDVRRDLSEELLAAEHAADSRLTRLQDELTKLFQRPAPTAQVERVRHEWEQARHRRDEVEREIRLTHPEYADIRYPRPPGLEQVQAWLTPGTALLEYALGERSSVLFVVTREELLALPLPPGAVIAALVAEVRRLLTERAVFTRPRLAAALAELTAILVAPAADRLATVDRLLVVPDRDLFYLPFEALGDPLAPQHGPGGLLRRWTVTYLPSAAVLPHLQRETTSDWRRDLLAFADPPPLTAPPADALRGDALPSLVPADGLPALPGARREAERIAALFPADRVGVHLGEAARESLLKSPQATASVRRLHIASHGVISTTDPEASYVLLAPDESDDGRLHLPEVFKLSLDAELVVLSGCETGLGPRLAGEGLLGLARGFLYAGARDLVVSLWSVADDETEELMVDFYRRLEAGRSTAEALREAKLARLDGGQTDPFLWAPFVVFGAPAPDDGRPVTSRSPSTP